MNIAYLISAHTDPVHLLRLVRSLNIPGITDFFVHLDKRADIGLFKDYLSMQNVKFCKKRILVQWGGFTQCKYQKALIEECLCSGKIYDRIFFLSGLDYPYWSNNRILKYLADNPEKEFICGMDITTCDYPKKIPMKLELYHFFRDFPSRNSRLVRYLNGFARLIMTYVPLRKPRYIEVDSTKYHIFQGSSWWCVTGKCLQYIYSKMNGKIEKYFKTCFAPDEMMVQTIVFNSPFKEKAILYKGKYPGLEKLTPLHLIDYWGG